MRGKEKMVMSFSNYFIVNNKQVNDTADLKVLQFYKNETFEKYKSKTSNDFGPNHEYYNANRSSNY